MSPALVILAAGLSTRFTRGLKQLAPVGPSGETLMDYCMYDAALAGFGSAIVVVRPELRAAVAAHIEPWSARLDVHIAEQSHAGLAGRYPGLSGRERPLGTAHAILAAREFVHGPFAIVNADDYYGPDAFYRMARAIAGEAGKSAHAAHAAHAPFRGWLAGYRLTDTLSANGGVTRAVCIVSPDGFLERIEEACDVRGEGDRIAGVVQGHRQLLDGTGIVSTNLWGFENSAFALLQEALDDFLAAIPAADEELRIADAVARWLEKDQVTIRVLSTTGAWFGLTYEGDLPTVQRAVSDLVDRHAYPTDLTHGSPSETSGPLR